MKKISILLIGLVYLTMMSCKHNTEQIDSDHDHENEVVTNQDHDHEEGEDEDHDHEEGELQYKTAKVAFETFSHVIKTSGEIQASNKGEIVISATNAGIIHFASNQITQGAVINPGQAIFYITGENLVDNNVEVKYNQVKSAYDKAKSDYDRAEQLVKKKIISEKEYEQSKMVYLSAKSEFDVIKKSAKGNGLITVQTKSYIKEFYIEEGQYVEAGQRLACVTTGNKLKLVAEVSQNHMNELSDIESATFMLSNDTKVYDTKELNGKLLSYGKAIDSERYYLPVVFEIDYNENLIPGAFTKIFLKGKKTEKCIVVPKTALIEEQGHYFVYVEEGHEMFHKHPVILGQEDGRNVVIKEGIHKEDTIVTEGAYFVKLATMSTAIPEHHHHH